jgi:hypothetical protein
LRKVSTDPGDEFEDEVRREDGLARYWMFLNGDSVRLFVALASALFGVLWCFLSILGIAQSFCRNVRCRAGGTQFCRLAHFRRAPSQI